jgi:hypothetical protein
MRATAHSRLLCVLFVAPALFACSRTPPQNSGTEDSGLIHAPPIKQLNLPQLKALALDCEKYLPGQFARGPYEAGYCQAAIDTWGDAPLQMIRIPASPPPR